MGLRRRVFFSNMPYEICMRVAEGLPFIPTATIRLLIRSATARAARGQRISICHFLWQANHMHLIFVVKDAKSAVKFYMELRRKLTEYIKRLTGVRRLKLWEDRPSIMLLPTTEDVITRAVYIYSNPAKDHLVDTITEFPGYSSYNHFITAFDKPDHCIEESTHYIPFDAIEPIGSLAPPTALGERLAKKLKAQSKITHKLAITPNAWMKCFNLEPERVREINSSIVERLKKAENTARDIRDRLDRSPMGAHNLRSQPFMSDHTPKNKDRRIFIICHDKERRISIIALIKSICDECIDLYHKACLGDFRPWPPGTFRPPIPPLASAI